MDFSGQWIIVYGTPVDGLDFIGPFTGFEEAESYAERKLKMTEFWLVKLEQPQRGDEAA